MAGATKVCCLSSKKEKRNFCPECGARIESVDETEITICLLGSKMSGKSAIALQYVTNVFCNHTMTLISLDEEYLATIGDCYYKKERVGSHLYNVRIQDTSGDEEYTSLLPDAIRSSDLFVFIYDTTDGKSLLEIEILWNLVVQTRGHLESFSCILVGTKKDLVEERQIPEKMGVAFSLNRNCQFMEVSSKNKQEVAGVFRGLLYMYDERQQILEITPKRKLSIFDSLPESYSNGSGEL